MKNIPNKIYIQVGEEVTKDDDFTKLNNRGLITFCEDRIFKNDLVYYRKPPKDRKDKYADKLDAFFLDVMDGMDAQKAKDKNGL